MIVIYLNIDQNSTASGIYFLLVWTPPPLSLLDFYNFIHVLQK